MTGRHKVVVFSRGSQEFFLGETQEKQQHFGAFCLDVRTLTFSRIANYWVFPLKTTKS